MLSTSSFLTSNINITPHHNSFLVTPKHRKIQDFNGIVISHGSTGIGSTETRMADFFLEKGFLVQLMDHFTPFGIEKLYWSYEKNFIDNYDVSLLDMINTMHTKVDEARHHVGISFGAYLGICTIDLFDKVFACYPGQLPIPNDLFPRHKERLFLFKGGKDDWAQLDPSFEKDLESRQIFEMKDSHHSFLSPSKDKACSVVHYKFKNVFYSRAELANISLSHHSLSKISDWSKIEIHNKSDAKATLLVKNKIYENTN